MRFSCDYGMKGGASSFLGNWCYKKPGQGKSHTWRSCCSFFGDRFGGRNDNLRLSWGFHLDHIGGGLVGVMWIHGIPANSLLLSTHRPVTTLVEWGETSCVLFVKKLIWGERWWWNPSLCLPFSASVCLLVRFIWLHRLWMYYLPQGLWCQLFFAFFLLNADTDYDRLENSCGENWEGGKNDSPVSHSVLVLESIDAIVVCLLAYTSRCGQ